jgi:hypothetical protein
MNSDYETVVLNTVHKTITGKISLDITKPSEPCKQTKKLTTLYSKYITSGKGKMLESSEV